MIDGWRYFGYRPADGESDADMGRRHAEVFLDLLRGEGFAEPNPRPMFPNPPGLLRLEPHAAGLRERIWWGAGSNATAVWAAKHGMNLQSSTLKNDETGEAFPCAAGRANPHLSRRVDGGGPHPRAPRVGQPQHLRADERSRPRLFRRGAREAKTRSASSTDSTRAIFGRSYAAEPDALIEQLEQDEAIAEADTLLLTIPNQLGVDYSAHVDRGDLEARRAGARLAVANDRLGEARSHNKAALTACP